MSDVKLRAWLLLVVAGGCWWLLVVAGGETGSSSEYNAISLDDGAEQCF